MLAVVISLLEVRVVPVVMNITDLEIVECLDEDIIGNEEGTVILVVGIGDLVLVSGGPQVGLV